MALLDALRALSSFTPPTALPECDLSLLADVLEAHGLAPMASYLVESSRLGGSLPDGFRDRLLTSYSGVLNDNVTKLVALRRTLRDIEDVPVVLLDAAAYLDWLYPHAAFRPIGDLRLAVRGEHGRRFVERTKETGLELLREEHGGRTAVFSDGTMTLRIQEGLWEGAPADEPLFARATPYRAFGRSAGRPSPEEALLGTIAEQALLGLHAPLCTYVDVRELLRLPLDAGYVRGRAEALGLSRALYGACRLAAHYFPEVEAAADGVAPALAFAEKLAVDRVVDAARDPARLRHLRGAEEAARLVVAPRA